MMITNEKREIEEWMVTDYGFTSCPAWVRVKTDENKRGYKNVLCSNKTTKPVLECKECGHKIVPAPVWLPETKTRTQIVNTAVLLDDEILRCITHSMKDRPLDHDHMVAILAGPTKAAEYATQINNSLKHEPPVQSSTQVGKVTIEAPLRAYSVGNVVRVGFIDIGRAK